MADQKPLTAEITYDGLLGGIKLNGEDLSQFVASITYRHEAGQLPTLILELNPEHANLKAYVGSVLLKGKAADPRAESAALPVKDSTQT